MRASIALGIALACAMAGGCATAFEGVALLATATRVAPQPTFSEFASDGQNYSPAADPGSGPSPGSSATSRADDAVFAFATDLAPLTQSAGDGSSGRENLGSRGSREAAEKSNRGGEPATANDDGAVMATDIGDSGPAPFAPRKKAPSSNQSNSVPPAPATATGNPAKVNASPAIEPKAAPDKAPVPVGKKQAKPKAAPPSAPKADSTPPAASSAKRNVQTSVKSKVKPAVGEHHASPAVVAQQQRRAEPAAQVAQAMVGDEPQPFEDSYVTVGDAPSPQGEIVGAPAPDYSGPFKPQDDESDVNRENRRLHEVPLDIRPTEGVMPTDVAAQVFEQNALADPRQSHDVVETYCAYTPWTICFRPLYFEDVVVERYGQKVPFVQSAICGAHFFSNVALLPYKMRLRPPRSCVCSNGFSRVGDCPPPGYGDCYWRWDAAVVEMVAVTGIVFILP
ncbi:MAG: hypothetical protein AB7O59_21070 [Pirellulales bacterium]